MAGFIGHTSRIIQIEPGEFYKLPERYGFVVLSLPYYSQIGVLCYKDGVNALLFTSNNAAISIDNSYLQITSEGDETKFKNNTSRTLEVVFNIIK